MYPYKQTKRAGRRVDEHRLLMEEKLGRRLTRFEFVHHKNGDKRDNRIENLELVSPKQHAVEHGQWKYSKKKNCEQCGKEFEPHPTKRRIALTCSKKCRYDRLSRLTRTPMSRKSRRSSSGP